VVERLTRERRQQRLEEAMVEDQIDAIDEADAVALEVAQLVEDAGRALAAEGQAGAVQAAEGAVMLLAIPAAAARLEREL